MRPIVFLLPDGLLAAGAHAPDQGLVRAVTGAGTLTRRITVVHGQVPLPTPRDMTRSLLPAPLVLFASLLAAALTAAPAGAQSGYAFGRTIAGAGNDIARSVAADGSGGAFVAGFFKGSVDLDGDGVDDFTASTDSSQDAFLIRYDATGDVVFARNIGGVDPGISPFGKDSWGVAADGAGGALIVGKYNRNLDLDGDGISDLGDSTYGSEGFLARYDAAGALVFGTAIRGTGDDIAYGVASDGAGGALVTGRFYGTADLDGDGRVDLSATGRLWEGFLIRYDGEGGLLFARAFGGPDTDNGYGVAPDGTGGAFVVGDFEGSADVDSDGTDDLTAASGSSDMEGFLIRYDAGGDVVFAHAIGGPSIDVVRGVAADGSGGVFVTGSFRESADLDGDGTDDLTAASSSAPDAFLARYDGEGRLLFARAIGGTTNARGFGVAADGTGGAFFSGTYWGSADPDGDGTDELPDTGSYSDAFLARYDATGGFVSARAISSLRPVSADGVASDGAGGAFVAGDFQGSTDLDGDGTYELMTVGGYDAFLAYYPTSSVAVEADPPTGLALSAWPNPAADRLTVSFALEASAEVRLSVSDLLGREVALLHDGPLAAGAHALQLDAGGLSGGVYVVRASTASGVATRRITFVR